MKIFLYIIAIVFANILTAQFPPFKFFGLLIPQGTFLIGLTFVLRDHVQIQYNRKITYYVIGIALILSAISTVILGNGINIVIASAISFAISELTDTEIFTRWKGSIKSRIIISGTIGSLLDSIAFTLIAGFPIQGMIGQLVVKTVMQFIGGLFIRK